MWGFFWPLRDLQASRQGRHERRPVRRAQASRRRFPAPPRHFAAWQKRHMNGINAGRGILSRGKSSAGFRE
jgi:hypothetical protein